MATSLRLTGKSLQSKDPFASLKESQLANAERTIYGQGIQKTAGSASTTIGDNIKNPHTFYTGTNPNNTPYYNTWSAKNKTLQSGATSTDNIVVKTIYDPCPVGYTTAPVNAFSTFTTGNGDSSNKGITLGGCWFPAVGDRTFNAGTLEQVGNNGHYWYAVPSAANSGRRLHCNSSSANPANNLGNTYGCCVRPVAEIEN